MGALAAAYARSRSTLERCNVRMLISVPLVVSVGFVVGAEMLEETDVRPIVTGGPGGTLSYGTERRSC
jgi:hypothetical protein